MDVGCFLDKIFQTVAAELRQLLDTIHPMQGEPEPARTLEGFGIDGPGFGSGFRDRSKDFRFERLGGFPRTG
jgi:hypothetical protein